EAWLEETVSAHYYFKQNPLPIEPEEKKDKPVVWPEVQEEFLGFRLQRELGRGAVSRVFLAEEPACGHRLVVVKVSNKGGRIEAFTQGPITHPNIVPIHSVQQNGDGTLTAVCMPYLGRATLCNVLARTASQKQRPVRGRAILEAIQDGASANDGC